jgi:hypothetical protein
VCETAVQLSLRSVYRYGGYCCLCNSSATLGTFCIYIWFVLLCVKQQCNSCYVIYIEMVVTTVCEKAVQLSVRTVNIYGVYFCV